MKRGSVITEQSLWTYQSVLVWGLFRNMAKSAGTKPHHILVIVAHLPMKRRCIDNCGVRSPFSNMHGMYFSPVSILLTLECYLVKFNWSINIDRYALLYPKLSKNTFGVMAFNHLKMYERHNRPPNVLVCHTICG